MSILIFSKSEGFLTDDCDWTTNPNEAASLSESKAKSLVSVVTSNGYQFANANTSELILSENFPSWMLEKAFSLDDREMQRFCDQEFGVSFQRNGADWVLYQSGGQRVPADEQKIKNVVDEAIRLSPSSKLIEVAGGYFGKTIHQIGVDMVALETR